MSLTHLATGKMHSKQNAAPRPFWSRQQSTILKYGSQLLDQRLPFEAGSIPAQLLT